MRHLMPLAALLFAAPAIAQDNVPPQSAALQKALKGRVAGAPVDCISLSRNRSSSIVDNQAIIYKDSPRRWYVNVPAGGACSSLAPRRAIITRIPSTRLCRGDLVNIVDLPQGFGFGACPLGSFTPYTK